MPNPDHKQAQELSAQAHLALSRGQREDARRLYAAAADLELESLERLPMGKPRSRGILAVSSAALLFKAMLYDRAERAICSFLAQDLGQPFHDQLRELLQVTWEEQILAQEQMHYSGAEILVALRGGRIGIGTAPAATAVHYLNGMNLLAYRAAELDAGLELRRHGLPPRAIQEVLETRATQPTKGSYRFSIRFLEPTQGDLFPDALEVKPPDPQRLSKVVVQVLRAIEHNDLSELKKAVPREDYRLALVRLARNVIPAGTALTEVEVRTAADSPTEAVYLRPEQRKHASEAIKLLSPPPTESDDEPEILVGTLRALNLDQTWLEIRPTEGGSRRLRTGQNELDDVIGPMVNRRVSARFQARRRGRSQPELRVLDIELLED